jgi:hypothetical protein
MLQPIPLAEQLRFEQSLRAEQGRLRGNHVEVRIDARTVPCGRQPQVPPRRFDGRILLLDLPGHDPDRREAVLHLLKGAQNGLSIGRDGLIERRLVRYTLVDAGRRVRGGETLFATECALERFTNSANAVWARFVASGS